MALARFERRVQDASGNLVAQIDSYEVRSMGDNALAALFSDRSGATPMDNPGTNLSGSKLAFHAAGGSYRITTVAGGVTEELTYVPIGMAAESDGLINNPKGPWDSGTTYAQSDMVSIADGANTLLFVSKIADNLNNAPDDSTPGSNAYWMYIGTVSTGADGTDPGYLLNWDDDNSDSNPSAGGIKADNDTLSSATFLYVSKTQRGGSSIAVRLAEIIADDILILTRPSDEAQASFKVSGAITDASGYVKIPLTAHDGATGFTAADAISLQRQPVAGNAASTTEVLTGTDNTKRVTADALAALWEKGSDVASSSTISLGEGAWFHITGTTTITDIDFATAKNGRRAWLIADAAVQITHGANLVCPGAAPLYLNPGDIVEIVQDDGDKIVVTDVTRADGSAVTLGTAQATTSGTTKNFTGIPPGVKHIRVAFEGVSLSGSDQILLRLGDSGGLEDASYVCRTLTLATGGITFTSTTNGFMVYASGAAAVVTGVLELDLLDPSTNTWVLWGVLSNAGLGILVSGSKSLSAVLDRVGLLASGSDSFDAGKVNISWA